MAHADRDVPDWSENAFQYIKLFVFTHALSKPQFIARDIRLAAKAWGLDMPPDNRAWGGPIRRAKREGIIVQIGLVPAPHRHCAWVPQYRAA